MDTKQEQHDILRLNFSPHIVEHVSVPAATAALLLFNGTLWVIFCDVNYSLPDRILSFFALILHPSSGLKSPSLWKFDIFDNAKVNFPN